MPEEKKVHVPLAARRYSLLRAVRKVDSFLGTAIKLMDTVNEIGSDPRPRNYIGAATKIMRMTLSTPLVDPLREDRLEWVRIKESYKDSLTKLVRAHCPLVETLDPGTGEDTKIYFYDLYGTAIIYCKKWDGACRFFKGLSTMADIKMKLGRLVWEVCPKWAHAEITGDYNSVRVGFEPGMQGEIHNSQTATDITERVKVFVDKGINRSLMLYGPPGTGKTSIGNQVAQNFGNRILSIEAGELSFASGKDIIYAIQLLDPDVLIINDFDRFSGSQLFLNTLEEMNRNIKLFMVTVNHKSRLERAVVRPGRFDELIEVKVLDDGVAKRLLKTEVPDEVFEEVKSWPAAFIAELGQRVEVLGIDKLGPEMNELRKRVEENDKRENSPLDDYL